MSKRTYRWMPELEAARALGLSVEATRKSVLRGSLKSRVTAGGIAQILVCLNPWVPAGENAQDVTIESTESPAEDTSSPVAPRPFAHALAGMNGREKITWMVVVLSFLLLVSLTIHAAKTQAGTNRAGDMRSNASGRVVNPEDSLPQSVSDSQPNVNAALSAIAKDFADARHRRRISHSTTAPTTQESFAMNDELPSDFQIGEIIPHFDPHRRKVMKSEEQTEESLDALPAPTPDSAPQLKSRFPGRPTFDSGKSDWSLLRTSRIRIGSEPQEWGLVLFEPETNVAPDYRNASLLPLMFLGGAPSSDVATGFHLASPLPDDPGSVGAGNPGTGGVGVEPPQLGDGISSAPEPGSLVLFSLASGPIILKRRRNSPVTKG